jgi:cystathionine beta-lyase/cystathionine gamma-synthase
MSEDAATAETGAETERDQYGDRTVVVGGEEAVTATEWNDVVTPIHLTATHGVETPGYPAEGYSYGRSGNPTRDGLRDRLGGLANADHVLAAASGTTAISTVCLSLLRPGDTVLAGDSLYGGTTNLFETFLDRFGIDIEYVDTTDTEAVADALDASVDLFWVESPTNPLLQLCDIGAFGELADDHDVRLVVDNTFATPYGQRPLELGADVTICSTTKFLNGHSDSIGGAISTNDEALFDQFAFVLRQVVGAPLSPFDSYLVLRGLKTLPARMDRHEHNAQKVAEFLADHENVAAVNYPGLASHPQHELARRQLRSYGGMLSFEIDVDGATTRALTESLDVFNLAFSLGGTESLVEHPASMSAAALSTEELAAAGISESLVRLSVGLETPEDLVRDLSEALALL